MKRRNFVIGIGSGVIGSTGLSAAHNDSLDASDRESLLSSQESNLIQFTGGESSPPNGVWSWYTGERAIVDTEVGTKGPRILVGSVSAGGAEAGDIVVLWYDIRADETGHYVLHGSLEQDDHNIPALFVRPDGRYLAKYAAHNSDTYSRWRVSTEPHDPTSWEPEETFDNEADTTYSNVYWLPNDDDGNGRLYSFTRTQNFDPNILVSSNCGSTWSYGGRLLNRGGGEDRPYPRYASDDTAIHLTTTEEHPRDFDNSIYHGYVEGGALYNSAGEVLKDDLLDNNANAPDPTELTTIFETGTEIDGDSMTRAWTVDTTVDAEGKPVTVFQTRVDEDWHDHRFFYAWYDNGWNVHHVAKAGRGLYDEERDYSGLAAIDPHDTSRIVISTPFDPRDDTELEQHELFNGKTEDRGETWSWRPLTPNTEVDNLRPIIPDWDHARSVLVWLRGQYYTWTEWDTQVVGRII